MTDSLRLSAKQQISAARALLCIVHSRAPADAPDTDQILDALSRLDATTERLARETYQPSTQEQL